MNRILLCMSLIGLCLTSCQKTDKKFLVTDQQVGVLQNTTSIATLDSLYAKDSVVNSAYEGELRYADNQRIQIFEKSGNELIEITPALERSEGKEISSVQILDARYTTEKGISKASTHKDIKEAYKDLELQQTMKSLIITPKGHLFYFIIDKSELNNPTLGTFDKVDLDDIPSEAKIKHFIINWN